MKIIRVEHFDGVGVFRVHLDGITREHSCVHQFSLENLMERHRKFPVPYCDNELDLNKDDKNWFCGYKSIKQIQEWIFEEEFYTLKNLGYKIWLIEVDEYQIGNYQVLFTKESVIRKEDITGLFCNEGH